MNKLHEHGHRPYGYSIGEAARASALTAKTIRYYEQIGLIPKAPRRSGDSALRTGGDRLYSEEDIGRLKFIYHARLVDLSLADIRKLLELADKAGCPSWHPEYSEVLSRHLRDIDERINHLLGLRTALQTLLNPARATGNKTCTWSMCSCMEPDKARSSFGVGAVVGGRWKEKSRA